MWEHRDVWLMILVSCLTAVTTEIFMAQISHASLWKSRQYRKNCFHLSFIA